MSEKSEIEEGAIEDFLRSIGITKKQFKSMRKDLLSSPLFWKSKRKEPKNAPVKAWCRKNEEN